MSGPNKVRIKIGDAEFEAEGPEEAVREQYNLFLEALRLAAAAEPGGKKPGAKPDGSADKAQKVSPGEDDPLIRKAFVETGDLLSLRLLPKTENPESDGLLLLLYGYSVIKGQDAVLSTHLAKAAAKSGINVDRVVRSMAKNEAFWMRGGARKGTNYSLNNQGVIKAKEVLEKMFN